MKYIVLIIIGLVVLILAIPAHSEIVLNTSSYTIVVSIPGGNSNASSSTNNLTITASGQDPIVIDTASYRIVIGAYGGGQAPLVNGSAGGGGGGGGGSQGGSSGGGGGGTIAVGDLISNAINVTQESCSDQDYFNSHSIYCESLGYCKTNYTFNKDTFKCEFTQPFIAEINISSKCNPNSLNISDIAECGNLTFAFSNELKNNENIKPIGENLLYIILLIIIIAILYIYSYMKKFKKK